MRKAIVTLVFQFASYASITGLYLTVVPISEPRSSWHWFLLGSGFILAIAFMYIAVVDQLDNQKKVFKDEVGIRNYMCKWISSPGRTVVFSRDLSWGDQPATKNALLAKSKRGELTIFLEKSTDISEFLRNAGATINLYGPTDFVPQSRFTIVGDGKQGSRVAVGILEEGKHVVYQFESGKHPIFALAKDLASLAAKLNLKP